MTNQNRIARMLTEDPDIFENPPKLLYYPIDKQPHLSFRSMQPITPGQAVEAATSSRGHVEIYVKYDDDHTPDVGFVFNNGKYVGIGLGSDRTRQHEKLAEQMKGQSVRSSARFWSSLFEKIVSGA